MAKLKAIVENLDSVPEALRELYTEAADGSFRLDAEGVEFEPDVAGLRSTLEKLKREAKDARELKKKLEQFEGVDPDEYRSMKAEAEKAESEKHKAKGDWEAREKQLHSKFEEETGKRDATINKYRASVEKALVESVAIAAIEKAGGSVTLLLPHVKSRVRTIEEGDEFVAQVVDAKGNPQIADAKGNPMTVEGLIESLRADKDYASAFRPTGASGSGAAAISNGRGAGVTQTVTHKDLMSGTIDPQDIMSGKVVVAGE